MADAEAHGLRLMSRVHTVLARYYDLRGDKPITSPLGQFDTGGPDQVIGGVDSVTAFLCDVGMVLAGLADRQREQIELYHLEHRAWEDTDARRTAKLLGRCKIALTTIMQGVDESIPSSTNDEERWMNVDDWIDEDDIRALLAEMEE